MFYSNESMVITLKNRFENMSADEIAAETLDTWIHVGKNYIPLSVSLMHT